MGQSRCFYKCFGFNACTMIDRLKKFISSNSGGKQRRLMQLCAPSNVYYMQKNIHSKSLIYDNEEKSQLCWAEWFLI